MSNKPIIKVKGKVQDLKKVEKNINKAIFCSH